jgi:hypothetical protein
MCRASWVQTPAQIPAQTPTRRTRARTPVRRTRAPVDPNYDPYPLIDMRPQRRRSRGQNHVVHVNPYDAELEGLF